MSTDFEKSAVYCSYWLCLEILIDCQTEIRLCPKNFISIKIIFKSFHEVSIVAPRLVAFHLGFHFRTFLFCLGFLLLIVFY